MSGPISGAPFCERAQRACAAHYGVSLEELRGRSRAKTIARARHAAMLLCRRRGMSLPEIGRLFDRHHTTILDVLRRLEDDADTMREIDTLLWTSNETLWP